MSVLRTVAHRRIRFIFFFITGFRTFPANHRIALRTQESSSLLRKAETCLFFLHRTLPQAGDFARPVPQPLYPQHPPPTSSATTCRRQTERNRNSGAYRLQQFQLPKQMFSRNVWMPSLGIYRESEENGTRREQSKSRASREREAT